VKTLPFTELTRKIGIDLGTARTRIWSDRDGVVVDQPSVVAVEKSTNRVIAVGDDAAAMIGRVNPEISLHFPVQQGKLYDSDVAQAMLRVWLQQVMHSRYFFRPVMMVSLPANSTQATRQVTADLCHAAGAREVYTISQPLAAAIGAGVPIADASGSFVMQLGAGCVEAAVISLGSIVLSESITQAGSEIDKHLQRYIKENLGLLISLKTAEKLKLQVATLLEKTGRKMLITGQDEAATSPKELEVTAEQIQAPILEYAGLQLACLKRLLSKLPPELTVDIIDKGMLLSGGLSGLHGLEAFLTSELGVPVAIVEDPKSSVIKGVGLALSNLSLFKESLGYR
jgi:rod shape-determining protein MreB and related proteins